jgi:hypothetical protein
VRSLVSATLHRGVEEEGRVQVRAIDFLDQLVKVDGEWKIANRLHNPTLQYDSPSQRMVLYKYQRLKGCCTAQSTDGFRALYTWVVIFFSRRFCT